MNKISIVVTCFLFLSACSSYGTKFNVGYVDDIVKGVTTEGEVVAAIGKPVSISRTSEGEKIFTYLHTKTVVRGSTFIPIVGAFAGGADSTTEMLQVWIDNTGTVSKYFLSESNSGLTNGVPAS